MWLNDDIFLSIWHDSIPVQRWEQQELMMEKNPNSTFHLTYLSTWEDFDFKPGYDQDQALELHAKTINTHQNSKDICYH